MVASPIGFYRINGIVGVVLGLIIVPVGDSRSCSRTWGGLLRSKAAVETFRWASQTSYGSLARLPYVTASILVFPPLNPVRELENHPDFNAGKGSVLTTEGTVEMEASIMDGKTKRCGAVSGLSTVVNPISLARLIMDKTPHIYLAFDAAEAFARSHGVETLEPSHFITPANIAKLKQAKELNQVQLDHSTPILKDCGESQVGIVGCVVVDGAGNLASATSKGGHVNKMVGRIGDTAIIGAGTYANHICAVSSTGKGEEIMRGTIARDVAALMEYKGLSLTEATAYDVDSSGPKRTCGLVAVFANGEVTMSFNTTGMYRACSTEDGYYDIGIWQKN